MKKLFYSCFICTLVMGLFSCARNVDYNEIVSEDKSKPLPVSNVTIENEAGAVQITYTLPNSDNILYVKATYEIREGQPREVVSSYYVNTMKLDGFSQAKEYKVALTTISRANVASDPVEITVSPTTPPYLLARKNLKGVETFGGILANAINTAKANVGITILKYDSLYKIMRVVTQKFDDSEQLSLTLRGYDPVSYYWGFVTSDQFGNSSDTLYEWITPILEVEMSKSKFRTFALSSDSPVGWAVDNLWDGARGNGSDGSTAWRSTGSAFPLSCTFDLGVTAQLSRYKLWGRQDNFIWTNENPTDWTMWGCSELVPDDVLLPIGAQKGDMAGNWYCLGRFEHPPKPSGLPEGQNTSEDVAFSAAGFDFDFDVNNPKVRYVRFCAERTFRGTPQCILKELSFFGRVLEEN